MSDVLVEIGQVAITSLVSLAGMFLLTRWGGKRQISQMSPFDYLNAVNGVHRRRAGDESGAVVPPRYGDGGVRPCDLGRAFYGLPQHCDAHRMERTCADLNGKWNNF